MDTFRLELTSKVDAWLVEMLDFPAFMRDVFLLLREAEFNGLDEDGAVFREYMLVAAKLEASWPGWSSPSQGRSH
ncbi:hypothetical protein [Mesorhizobium huakuii]|uniref:Uncharacterized protein n=1 Tax=Mesorhizobium huakuii TaxID=28104 RepID=A0A7G6T0T7_9HYPH|nr:hypothetical protein [Mesorhizobium huakuii]QND60369.1 hypothetical protein HB778_30350 [Mesorhizobium huakuii]